MKKLIGCVALVMAMNLFSADMLVVHQQKRAAQIDGLLVEWNQDSVRTLLNNPQIFYDLAVSAKGVSGYLCMESADSCRVSTIVFDGLIENIAIPVESLRDTFNRSSSTAYAVLENSGGGKKQTVVEFMLPVEKIAGNLLVPYTVSMTLQSTCADTLYAAIISGAGNAKNGASSFTFTTRMKYQVMFILLLGAVYLYFRILVKRKMKKK